MEAALLTDSYQALLGALERVDDAGSWAPTGCLGWSVRDLTHHLWGDAQRALVALHTPAEEAPDRDAVSYWGDWGPDATGAAAGRRYQRVVASMFLHWKQLRGEYADTARAMLHAAGRADPAAPVTTQGHVLRVADLLSTLAVEATVHHLDLLVGLPDLPGPSPAGLGEARRVVGALLGVELGPDWSDERCVLVGTGRAEPTEPEQAALGDAVSRLPVFC